MRTASPGMGADKLKKDLYHILNSSVGAIDHRAESFRDEMEKFSPLLGDLAFCAGAACGSVEAALGRGKFKGKGKFRAKKGGQKKKTTETTGNATGSSAKNRAQHERYKSDLAQEEAKNPAPFGSQIHPQAGEAFPNRPLPVDGKNKIPDSRYPHTQLGNRKGRKSEYPQAREFGANGELVRDIDFTDHNRSQNHPKPHVHVYKPSATGGTMEREKTATPLIIPKESQ